MGEVEDLKRERDRLREEVDELLRTKDWLYERWQTAERRLAEVHGSKMWRVWMASIALRRAVLSPFRMLAGIPSALRGSVDRCRKAFGWIWVGLASTWLSLRARARRSMSNRRLEPSEGLGLQLDGVRPRVLIMMPYCIHPPNHGGGVRLYHLIQLLSKRCDIYAFVFSASGEDEAQRAAIRPFCAEVFFHHWVARHRPDPWGLRPPNAQLFWSDAVANRLPSIIAEYDIDIVQLEYTELGQYVEVVPPGIPVILTEHDIAFRTQRRRRALRFMERFPDSKAYGATGSDLRRLLVHEVRVCRAADSVHTMSAVDGRYLASFLPDGGRRIRVAPNGVDCCGLAPPEKGSRREGVLYVGNFQNLPNVDALEYLVEDVWPILRLRRPDARLSVVGAHAGERVLRFDGAHGVSVVGEVPEIAPHYHRHRVLAVPIRAGSGTRLKILEAFAAGIPVVTTTLGAEGIDYEPGTHLLVADDAVAFAAAIERLLSDDDLAARLAEEGMKLAQSMYDWRWVAAAIESDYAALLGRRRR